MTKVKLKPKQAKANSIKSDVMRSYRAGMMQGFRMLQSYMTFEQQARFGFHDEVGDDKINATLDRQADVWWDDNYA